MKQRTSPLALLSLVAVALIAGCATPQPPGPVFVAAQDSGADEQRLVVVTVDNGDSARLHRPGSTRPAYSAARYEASDAARATMRGLAADYELTEVAAWPIRALQVHCAVFRIPARQAREAVLQRLASDHRVRLAQPMNGFASSSSGYNDPYLSVQSGFRSIDAAGAQQWSRGDSVRVAVIDTGIDATHPDFAGHVILRRNFVDRDEGRFVQDRHGTAVAGIISAAANNKLGIVGVAPGVEILAFKACWQLDAGGEAARCNSLTIAQALAAALEEHAQVVNLSLTGPRDPLLNSLVAAGIERGVLFVGAAPADGSADGFPAAAPGMIAVDMVESGHARSGVLRAPGRDVVTLVPGGRYDFLSGASLAAAHVTGAIALLLAKDRHLDRDAAYALLEHSEGAQGAGEVASINACLALAGLLHQGSCPEPRAAAVQHPGPELVPTRR
ncbi:MAG: S8 family serine peptidase [Pseudomonadota bacterium]